MNCVSSFNNVIKFGILNSLYPTDFRFAMSFNNSLVASTNETTYSEVVARTNPTTTTTPSYNSLSIKGSHSLQINANYYLALPPQICTGLNAGCISVWVKLNDTRKTTIFGLQVDGSNSYGFLTIGSYNGGGGS